MTDADSPAVVVTRDSLVWDIVLNRPRVLNALSPGMHRDLQAAIGQFNDDPQARVAVLSGAGRAFCAGSDVTHTRTLDDAGLRAYVGLDFDTKNVVAASGKPEIAAIQGHCVGGGLELALACDLRIGASSSRYFFGELRIGTIPGAGGLQRLRAVVGAGVASEWVLTARTVEAEEAERRGLITMTVPDDVLLATAHATAQQIAAHDPVAVELAKSILRSDEPLPSAARRLHQAAAQVCHGQPAFALATDRFQA